MERFEEGGIKNCAVRSVAWVLVNSKVQIWYFTREKNLTADFHQEKYFYFLLQFKGNCRDIYDKKWMLAGETVAYFFRSNIAFRPPIYKNSHFQQYSTRITKTRISKNCDFHVWTRKCVGIIFLKNLIIQKKKKTAFLLNSKDINIRKKQRQCSFTICPEKWYSSFWES